MGSLKKEKRITKITAKYQIDQSGKIENTAKTTYIALANGKTLIIRVSSVEKRKLIKTIRELRRPHKTYIYQIFAALVFILLKEEKIQQVVIDTEYPGHQASIKEVLVQLFQRFRKDMPEINFGFVGKKSNAHIAANEAYRKKRQIDITIKAEDILKLLYSNSGSKKGWRPRSGRGNP